MMKSSGKDESPLILPHLKADMVMIQISDLQFKYDDNGFVLNINKLVIQKGEKVAFVGPSGCGKTTLLYLMAGICKPTLGQVVVAGRQVHNMEESDLRNFRSTHMGFIFQQFELLEYLKGRENILLTNYINNSLSVDSEKNTRVQSLSESLGVSHLLDRFPAQMSQGEKQRIAICRAMINKPQLVIADEPTGNLDPKITSTIMELIFKQVTDGGSTFLMVTHDHALLDSFDKVIDFQDFLKGSEA